MKVWINACFSIYYYLKYCYYYTLILLCPLHIYAHTEKMLPKTLKNLEQKMSFSKKERHQVLYFLLTWFWDIYAISDETQETGYLDKSAKCSQHLCAATVLLSVLLFITTNSSWIPAKQEHSSLQIAFKFRYWSLLNLTVVLPTLTVCPWPRNNLCTCQGVKKCVKWQSHNRHKS